MKSIVTLALLTVALANVPARAEQATATLEARAAGRFAAMGWRASRRRGTDPALAAMVVAKVREATGAGLEEN